MKRPSYEERLEQYEAAKRRLREKNLPYAEYERELQKIINELKI